MRVKPVNIGTRFTRFIRISFSKIVIGYWGNFLKFFPGLVGGHCIGVDPYYLTHKAEMLGYHSQVILAGRRVNDSMGIYVAENCVKHLIAADKRVKGARVAILGFSFKENCPDSRNTKVYDIVRELREYGIEPIVSDPISDARETERLYGLQFVDYKELHDLDAVILAVAHDVFADLRVEDFDTMYTDGDKILLDIKGILNRKDYENASYRYWRL